MHWNREYHYYLIFGDTAPDYIPWETNVWNTHIYPILNNILLQSDRYKQTGVGSLQYIPQPGSSYYEQLKLGRLSWNAASQEKWTLSGKIPGQQFHHLDIWTPSRGVCEKINASPDIMISLCNERSSYQLPAPQFDTFTVLAVAKDLNYDPLPAVLQLSAALKAKKTVYRMRGWQQQLENENWQLINSIQDTMSANIYKGETDNLQKIDFEKIKFEPFWEMVYEGGK